MLSTARKQALFMNAKASPTVAVAPTARREQAAANPVTHAAMANAIRALAMDAVEQAKSGHPGMPMGMADVATVLFTRFLKFDPADPAWPDRDRFVLSAGHGSMLLYALLYLTGYEAMTIDEIKRFRQLGSITPGHPEHGHTPGVETTTGPLGQGLANAVGMAIAERHLAAEFGDVVDHKTYVIASDGDLMEGISQEAIALAGHLKLNRLIVLFDDNGISIDGALIAFRFGRSAEALRGGRLGGLAHRRPRSASDCRGHRQCAKFGSPRADRLQDHDRLRRAEQGRQGVGARLAARRRRDQRRARKTRLVAGAVRDPRRHSGGLARRRPALEGGARRLEQTPRRARCRQARRVRAAHERRVAAEGVGGRGRQSERDACRHAQGHRHAQRLRIRAREPGARRAGNARRLGRSDRLQQHAHQIDAGAVGRRLFRPLHPLRRARARHGRPP